MEIMLATNPEWNRKKIVRPEVSPEQRKTTCTETGLVGKIYPKTTKVVEKKWDEKCIIDKIDSCMSRVQHTENWCSVTFYFKNCPRQSIIGSTCINEEGRGECTNTKIKGNINKIDLFEGYWKGFKEEPIPSGFTMYTDQG